ncbi:MAG: hypothetical protein JWP78_782 [Mucilaginibacter sp.]|nr:hypothetical protein [Mucilaginibacter sp.]
MADLIRIKIKTPGFASRRFVWLIHELKNYI